ncbi:hypothetical protein PTT_17322 [Pyrenophora teres f. teres 0-1]|uniref:Uncharacterized protein n=1 Tax=Pyrenophora teres f. teres (strain 0-1) TaxID=861557 RepID=E3S468_PYRTT|nr:hypothetical protein PTT_17322 [Pyrenophora teres f. teres 0-1]
MSSTPPDTSPGTTSTTLEHMLPAVNKLVIEDEECSSPSFWNESSLSPSDCRTLYKLLIDTGSSSPFSRQPLFSANSSSPPAPDSAASNLVVPESEDESFQHMEHFDYANEHEAGYQDDNDSMDMDDTDDTLDTQEKDDLSIEDDMSLAGATAPSLPVQDFGSFYDQDESMSNGSEVPYSCRSAVEISMQKLEEQLRNKNLKDLLELLGPRNLDEPFSAPVDKLEYRMRHTRDQGRHRNRHRLTTTPVESSEATIKSSSVQITSTSYHSPPYKRHRRASDPDYSRFSPDTMFPYSNSPFYEYFPVCTTPDSPSSPVVAYYKGLENSTPKRRRKASSPEELAQLAREARVYEEEAEEEKELQELDQYRDFDLAPIEPVMESEAAGDLIMSATPAKVRAGDDWNKLILPSSLARVQHGSKSRGFAAVSPLVDTEDEEYLDASCLARPCAPTPSSRRPSLPVEQDEEDDADVEDWDFVVRREDEDVFVEPYEPTFVTVIGMLPAVMFWATAAPVVKLGNDAFDMLVERLTGLKV